LLFAQKIGCGAANFLLVIVVAPLIDGQVVSFFAAGLPKEGALTVQGQLLLPNRSGRFNPE
jgi:hypothetical protein